MKFRINKYVIKLGRALGGNRGTAFISLKYVNIFFLKCPTYSRLVKIIEKYISYNGLTPNSLLVITIHGLKEMTIRMKKT